MNPALSDLERGSGFALLGPGFGTGRWLLLEGLREAAPGPPALMFARFETPGDRPGFFRPASVRACEPRLDVPGRSTAPRLEARGYEAAIDRIRAAIAHGDVYQVCLTVRARLDAMTGAQLLATLCARGVPRFAAWVRLPDGEEFVSASPELLFGTRGTLVRTEPMKGTAPSGARGALLASAKDEAELAMITDLLRNDLAPVCRPRTVRVVHRRRVVELPYAVQTVSDVTGRLTPGVTPPGVLAALHPGGSVTGAPKAAALAMIRELEPGPRGPYCGALGWWTERGAICSLLIRTATADPAGWVYGVGGGIVYDSDPRLEREELEVKLGALRCPTRC